MRSNKRNIKAVDGEIKRLIATRTNEKDDEKVANIDKQINVLVECRAKLQETPRQHHITGAVISGLFSLAGILLVLHYEEKDIITSKAYNVASRMIGG